MEVSKYLHVNNPAVRESLLTSPLLNQAVGVQYLVGTRCVSPACITFKARGVDEQSCYLAPTPLSPPVPKVVTFGAEEVVVYPTEQAIKQKEARKLKAEKLEAEGMTPEEVKKNLIKKKKFWQEDHHDDCGSDMEPIMEAGDRAKCFCDGRHGRRSLLLFL